VVPTTTPTRLSYRPALDGLRAVAVLAVMLYHGGGSESVGLGRGGLVGVDVFFVLSGFLITTLLLEERRDTGGIAFVRFWSRRARRLLPALLLMLVLAVVLARSVYSEATALEVRDDLPYVLLYVENWHVALWHGPLASPLSHAWSLSVEEQFYIVWPVVLAGLVAVARPGAWRRLLLMVAGLATLSAIWTPVVEAHFGRLRAYFGTDTRAQQLLVGAALAVVTVACGTTVAASWRRRFDVISSAVLVALVVVLLLVPPGPGWYRGGFLAIAVATGVVVLAAVQPEGWVRAALGVPVLVAVGRISYGLYLFHFPLYRWLNGSHTGLHGPALLGLRFAATFAVAALSYRLLERPVRAGRGRGALLVAAGLVVVAGVVLVLRPLTPGSPRPSALVEVVLREAWEQAPEDSSPLLLVGGSRAAFLSLARPTFAADGVWGAVVGTPGCGWTSPARGCRALPDALEANLDLFPARTVVVMLDEGDVTGVGGRAPASPASFEDRMDEVVRAAGDRRVVVIAPPCDPRAPRVAARVEARLDAWAARRGVDVAPAVTTQCVGDRRVERSPDAAWRAVVDAAR
jgi:peptidoglycan/LPS O-acetylase OafA/YrhL